MSELPVLKLIGSYIWMPLLAVIGYFYASLQSLKSDMSSHRIDVAERHVTRTEMTEIFKDLRESQREVATEIKSAHNDLAKEVKQLNQTLIKILAERQNRDTS